MDDYVTGLLDRRRLEAELNRLKRLVSGRVWEDEAEEIALETIAVLWTEFGRPESNRDPLRVGPAYATVVALNLARRTQRYEMKLRRGPLTEETIIRSVDDQVDALAGRREISDALRALPGRERTVIYLFYIEDHSVADIARLLRLSESTIRTQLSQGRKRLACFPWNVSL
jgi:RNA polymerase sigma factor (sigma-70 family)